MTATIALQRPRLGRLTGVELRKMTDTRAGFWLQLGVAALTIAVAVITALTGNPEDHRLYDILGNTIQPAVFLLPVLGVLLVTSEWSQRTAQITFTLVPKRSRVLWAKLLAGLALSLEALVLCVVVSVIATALVDPSVAHAWSLPIGALGQLAVYVATSVVIGIAFGAVLLSSAPAIVLNFALPIAWSALGTIKSLEGTAEWLDQSRSLPPLSEHLMSATEWAQAGTTLALWMVLPLVVGAWRIARSEIR